MTVTCVNDRMLRAARGERVDATPVWIMRQAGRVLPGYRALRGKHSFLDLARRPELCAEVTIEPVERLDVDAAILFSDILLPLEAMGIPVDFRPGPVLERWDPSAGTESLCVPDPRRHWAWLDECVRATLDRLEGRVPLIGFAGAPFTLATYLLEGGSSKEHEHTRRMMHSDPESFAELLAFLADRIADWLGVQVRAGAHAVQLFDSWAGVLSPPDLESFALPAARRVFDRLAAGAELPTIYFAPGAGAALALQTASGARMLGLDWRVRMADARALFPTMPLQGNLDPGALLGSERQLAARVREVLEGAGAEAGHVFNLGHGILPMTEMRAAQLCVRLVHDLSREMRS
ncbi:MAG: uroporphyrinogen decarboxylase [Candidatus Eiseniibacteriota bacterium]